MIRLVTTACIEAPPEVVWAHLSKLDALHLWTDAVHHSYLSGSCSSGVGAERVCDLGHRREMHERVTAWTEGQSFTYESADAPMMKRARNTWSIQPDGRGTRVVSEAEVELRGGIFGRLLELLFRPLLGLFLPNPLAKFKYWVETGRPFQGKASRLPVPVAVC